MVKMQVDSLVFAYLSILTMFYHQARTAAGLSCFMCSSQDWSLQCEEKQTTIRNMNPRARSCDQELELHPYDVCRTIVHQSDQTGQVTNVARQCGHASVPGTRSGALGEYDSSAGVGPQPPATTAEDGTSCYRRRVRGSPHQPGDITFTMVTICECPADLCNGRSGEDTARLALDLSLAAAFRRWWTRGASYLAAMAVALAAMVYLRRWCGRRKRTSTGGGVAALPGGVALRQARRR